MNFITVVGAGPIGLNTAIELKKEGFEVSVLEEHENIGVPENCSGLISASGTKELRLNLEDCLENNIFGARIHSPAGEKLMIEKPEPVAHVINRKEFDESFFKKALDLGVDIKTKAKLIDIRKGKLFLEHHGRGELASSDFIIGADGVNSIVRNTMTHVEKENFIHSIQAHASGSFDQKLVEVFFGDFAPGFFAWIIPENKEKARIGLGAKIGTNIEENFKKFLIEKELHIDYEKASSALIPCGPPLKEAMNKNIFLAGDAAFQTKATTGGGIILGLKASNILAETIKNHLKFKSLLTNYDANLKSVNKELNIHWKVRKYFNSLNSTQVNDLFSKMKKAGLEEFLSQEGDMDKPSTFISKALKKPKMWGLAPTLMRFIT